MTTSKATQIAKDIEDARCKGNWKLMPELARRYRKHNPKGEGINTTHVYHPTSLLTDQTAVLAQTIIAEASLAQLVQDTQSSLLNADQVKSIRHQLQSVIHMTDTATATDRQVEKELHGHICMTRANTAIIVCKDCTCKVVLCMRRFYQGR